MQTSTISLTDPKLDPIWDQVQAGERLTREEGLILFGTHDLIGLGRMARFAKERKTGRNAYFVLNRQINPTNLCVITCKFCDFAAKPGEPHAYEMSMEEILSRCDGEIREVHIVGGLHPKWKFEHYVEIVRQIKARYPEIMVKAYTAVEMDFFSKIAKIPIEDVLRRLKEAGLDTMPGGGAEVFSERVRKALFSQKIGADRWLAIHRLAHRMGIRSNSTLLYGHIETHAERVDHMLRLRELQDETGGFFSFIPLEYQLGTTMLVDRPASAIEDLKTIAVARLLLDNFTYIKAYWVMLGEDTASTALSWGADDLDGTIGEEKIAHFALASSPVGLTREALIRSIRQAGCIPVERDSRYQPVGTSSLPKPRVSPNERVLQSQGDLREKILAGERISPEEGLSLLKDVDLLELGELANAVRLRLHPEPVVTFVIDSNPNYTNICDTDCTFCAFYRRPGAPDGYWLTVEQVMDKVQRAADEGATTVLLQGGHNPAIPFSYYLELIRTIRQRFPQVTPHCFTASEVQTMARISGLPVREVLRQLKEAGQFTLPGGGAEILSTRMRKLISPKKGGPEAWIEVHREAHSLGFKSTATMMYGHLETPEDVVEHLERVRALQDETGGFTAFVPWSFKPDNTSLGKRVPVRAGPNHYFRILAVSRIYLDNFPHVQASWFSEGKKTGQVALHFGADDFGGTLLEENVHKAANFVNTTTTDDVIALIREAGFIPAQRTTLYDTVKIFS